MCQNGQKKYVLTYQIELQHVHMRKGPSFCGSNNVRQRFFYKIRSISSLNIIYYIKIEINFYRHKPAFLDEYHVAKSKIYVFKKKIQNCLIIWYEESVSLGKGPPPLKNNITHDSRLLFYDLTLFFSQADFIK